VYRKRVHLIFYLFFICAFNSIKAQLCNKDSNYYSFTYTGGGNNYVKDALVTSSNEVVALCGYDAVSTFVTKFTAQGSVIWSNEFSPDYPHTTWVQYPWYNNTEMLGISAGKNDTYYTYGSCIEHGKSINNVEEPPSHRVGLLFHFDKYGNKISGKYFGDWRTEYSVRSLLQLQNGNIIVYLRSHFTPKISKVICVNDAGDFLWAAPIQCSSLIPYNEIDGAEPVMQQLANGNIVVARIMQRDIPDTIQYPFQPPIIIPTPIHYFNLFEFDGKNGQLVWENSFQCPTLTNTNAPNTFVPQLKNLTQLPDGKISVAADMYLPRDTAERFYAYKNYSKRAVNYMLTADGFNHKLFSYYPQNGACTLEKAITNSNGTQLFVARDSATGNTLLFKINAVGEITETRAYADNNVSATSHCTAVEKKQQGYFIFQSNANSPLIKSIITDAAGNTGCAPSQIKMVAQNGLWPWLVDKVRLTPQLINYDFRYSPFTIKQEIHSLQQQTTCQYMYVCCTDVIDSLHPRNIEICENENYILPDNAVVNNAGTYYATLKTTRGCDSVLFYNVKKLKLPSSLTTSPDTCLNNTASVILRASDGFDKYLWNNTQLTTLPYLTVQKPGVFTVSVKNKCGAKTDTISVYEQCDFPIFLPNAFTPNNDFLNDVLKIPEINKNRLRRLTIFNRYGQAVFKTENIKKGWDGTYKGLQQESGAYTYLLEMEGLSGKKIVQKGTIILIR
jgi:gliding motility-associated-like protein